MQINNNLNEIQQDRSLSKDALKSSIHFGFWGWIFKGIAIFNSLLILKYLTIYAYGVVQLTYSFLNLMVMLLIGGLQQVVSVDVNRLVRENQMEKAKKLFKEFALIKTILGIVIWIMVFYGANLIDSYYSENVALFIKIISFIIIIESLQSFIILLFKVHLKFFLVSILPVINEVIKFVLIVILVNYYELNIQSLLTITVISQALVLLISFYNFLKLYRQWKTKVDFKNMIIIKIIKGYGKWSIFRDFFGKILVNIRPWLIKILIGTEAVAIFSVAKQIITNIQKAVPLDGIVILLMREVKKKSRFELLFNYGIKYSTAIFILISVFSYFVVPLFLKLLLPKYLIVVPHIRFMLLLVVSFGLIKIINSTMITLRRQKYLFYRNVLQAMAIVLLSFILYPIYGLWGVVIEYIVTIYIFVLINFYYLFNYSKTKLDFSFAKIFIYNKNDKYIFKNFFKILKQALIYRIKRKKSNL